MPFVMEIFVHNSFRTVDRRWSHGDPGVWTPIEIWLWGLLWLRPPRKFYWKKFNISKIEHQKRLFKPTKHCKSLGHQGFAPDLTLEAYLLTYCSAPQTT